MDRPLIQNTQQDQQNPRYDDYLKASSLYTGPVTEIFSEILSTVTWPSIVSMGPGLPQLTDC